MVVEESDARVPYPSGRNGRDQGFTQRIQCSRPQIGFFLLSGYGKPLPKNEVSLWDALGDLVRKRQVLGISRKNPLRGIPPQVVEVVTRTNVVDMAAPATFATAQPTTGSGNRLHFCARRIVRSAGRPQPGTSPNRLTTAIRCRGFLLRTISGEHLWHVHVSDCKDVTVEYVTLISSIRPAKLQRYRR
jgi:hypothetical protein